METRSEITAIWASLFSDKEPLKTLILGLPALLHTSLSSAPCKFRPTLILLAPAGRSSSSLVVRLVPRAGAEIFCTSSASFPLNRRIGLWTASGDAFSVTMCWASTEISKYFSNPFKFSSSDFEALASPMGNIKSKFQTAQFQSNPQKMR